MAYYPPGQSSKTLSRRQVRRAEAEKQSAVEPTAPGFIYIGGVHVKGCECERCHKRRARQFERAMRETPLADVVELPV